MYLVAAWCKGGVFIHTSAWGFRRCSFRLDGQCESLDAWNERQSTVPHAFFVVNLFRRGAGKEGIVISMKESFSKICFLLGITLLSVNITVEAQTSPYSRPRTYPQYQSPYNMDLIYGAMKYKQDAFNRNWAYIQPKLQELNKLIVLLNEKEIELSNNQRNWINKQLDWIRKNMNNIDFSNNTNSIKFSQWLDDIMETIVSWAEESLKREYQRNNINNTNVHSKNSIPYVSGYVYVIKKNDSFSYVERNGVKGYISNTWFKR